MSDDTATSRPTLLDQTMAEGAESSGRESVEALFIPGAELAGRYRIQRFIARGGAGEVYQAEDLELGEIVALKTMTPDRSADERSIERFKREISIARQVTHPNVCRIFEFGRDTLPGGREILFLTMQYLEGESLSDLLRREVRLSPTEALPLINQMAAGLEASHRAGVIHRDFKSANVLLFDTDRGMRAVITDFGIASRRVAAETDPTAPFRLVGTPLYMAPEQLTSGKITPATDIYAFGVVIYEMLTGAFPFEAEGPLETAMMRLSVDPPPPSRWVTDLDPQWEEVILRCLEIEPEKRYPSAAAVGAALGTAIPASGFTAAYVQMGGRREESEATARSVVPWWLTASALLLMIVTAVWFVGRGEENSDEPLVFRPQQLTVSPGLDVYPTFSPGGDSVAYSSSRDGRFVIFSRSLSGAPTETALTPVDEDSFQPSWSPDGRRIAYVSRTHGGIWMIDAFAPPGERPPPQQLTDFGSRPSWSPDSSSIVFQSDSDLDLSASALPAMPPSVLWIVPIDGDPPLALTRAGEPAGGHGAPNWSPDGTRIVFSASDRRSADIWTIGVDGKGLEHLASGDPKALFPAFAADGEAIFYSTGDRSWDAWRLAIDDEGKAAGEPRWIANMGQASVRHWTISRDGKRIAYSLLTTSSNLWSLPLDPASFLPLGEPVPLTRGSARNARPVFSGDGAYVAYERWRSGVESDVWTLSIESGDAVQQTTNPRTDSHISWFPDRQSLAHLTEAGDRADPHFLYQKLDLASEETTELYRFEAHPDWVRLSPDGARIAFHSPRDAPSLNLLLAELPQGEPRVLTADREGLAFPIWSPDGERLALQLQRGDDVHVVVLEVETGEMRQLTDAPGRSWPFSWSPDGRYIAFAGQRGSYWNLYRVSLEGEVVRLTDERRLDAYFRYPAWSPRGDRIVYETAENTGDIWLLEN